MDNAYLKNLIDEANARGGGMLLNLEDRPAAVVLTVEKYNKLIGGRPDEDGERAAAAAESPERAENYPAKRILVTGGAGYIGSHLVRELIKNGYLVTVLDNLSCGKRENVDPRASFIEGDLGDENLLKDLFASGEFYAVIHMAASIEVEESVREPQKYFQNNVINTGKLLKAMSEAGVSRLVFSSTAAVYGDSRETLIKETSKTRPNNPYGRSKLLAEEVIKYFSRHCGIKSVVFRYFNACGFGFDGGTTGTHFSHLLPIVLDVARGRRPVLTVNGRDYETADGTCVRDYVHVLDIVGPHILALDRLDGEKNFEIFNIGTGRGCSVREVAAAAAETLNRIIPMEEGPRRPGDPACLVADNSKLTEVLGYRPQFSDLPTIIRTTWDQMG